MLIQNKSKLKKSLEMIKNNPDNVLTNSTFCECQWLQYNVQKKCFEYEDGAFLGYSSSDVIALFESLILKGMGDWLKTAEWVIKQKRCDN